MPLGIERCFFIRSREFVTRERSVRRGSDAPVWAGRESILQGVREIRDELRLAGRENSDGPWMSALSGPDSTYQRPFSNFPDGLIGHRRVSRPHRAIRMRSEYLAP